MAKARINGRIYNEDTAKFVGEGDNGHTDCMDFAWLEWRLYRSKRGEYFIRVNGGPHTGWGCYDCDTQTSGYEGRIIVLPEEDGQRLEKAKCSREAFRAFTDRYGWGEEYPEARVGAFTE